MNIAKLVAVAALATSIEFAFADTVVKVYNRCETPPLLCHCDPEGDPDEEYRYDEGTHAIPTAINLSTCAQRVVIEAPWDEDMRRIVLTGGPAAPTTVSISIVVGFNEGNVPPLFWGGHDWGGLDASGVPSARFYGGIYGALKDSIRVDQLYWFSSGGAIEAQIWADESGNFGQCVVEAGSIAAGGSVRVDKGNILRIKAFGAMAGNITAGGAILEPDPNTPPDGIIERIEVGTNLTGNVYALGSNASIKILQVGGNVAGKIYAE
jgi:hypothetical protein